MVADEGMAQQVEYISFSMKACERLVTAGAKNVSYLGSDVDDFIKAGVDFITTNKPVEAMKLAR